MAKQTKGCWNITKYVLGLRVLVCKTKEVTFKTATSCNKAHTCFALRNYYFQINKQDITSLVTALENTLHIYLGLRDNIQCSAFFRPLKEN